MSVSHVAIEVPAPVVILRDAVAGLLIVIVLAAVVADERQPYTELNFAHPSLSMPPTPVASAALLAG